jgi:hypothetical protein
MQSDRIEAPLARENEMALAIVAVTDNDPTARTGECPRKTDRGSPEPRCTISIVRLRKHLADMKDPAPPVH